MATSSTRKIDRLWPSLSGMAISILMLFICVFGIGASLVEGRLLGLVFFLVVLLYPIFSFGWFEVTSEEVRHVRLLGGRTVPIHDIGSIKLDFQQANLTKWWFPVLVLRNHNEVKLSTLKSMSREQAGRTSMLIQKTLNDDAEPDAPVPGKSDLEQSLNISSEEFSIPS